MSHLQKQKMHFKNKSECRAFIIKLAEKFEDRQIILLQGAMGSGKTQLVSWLVESFCNSQEASASPTYAFHHHYNGSNRQIEHFDLDRVSSESDLESIGFWDIFSIEAGWVIVEWPERLDIKHLPPNWPCIHIKIDRPLIDSGEERIVEII